MSWKGAGRQSVSWKLEGVPSGVSVEGGWIKFRAARDSLAGTLYSIQERWVTDDNVRDFESEDLGRLWLRFQVRPAARPAVSSITLVLRARESKDELRVPFELRVYKDRAEPVDFPVGPFSANVQENWWSGGALKSRLDALEKLSWSKMRGIGLTGFSFPARIPLRHLGARLAVDTGEIDRVMTKARAMGFLGLVEYGGALFGENLCTPVSQDSQLRTADDVRQLTQALEARSHAANWLPLTLVLCDEPVGAAVPVLTQRLRDFPKTGADARVRWAVTTSLGREATPETRALVTAVDLPFLSDFKTDEIKFPWVFYNTLSRSSVGLGMYRLRRNTDLRGRFLWSWNQNASNPYFAFDGREDDYAWCSSTLEGKLRCSVELDRVVDRGLTDYRVALTLKRALARPQLTEDHRFDGLTILNAATDEKVDPDAWLEKAAAYLEGL